MSKVAGATERSYSAQELLINCVLSRCPLALFLGQSACLSGDGNDSVLAIALDKLQRAYAGAPSWKLLVTSDSVPDDFYVWLAERFTRRPLPDWMKSVAGFPWTSIFTSSLDPSIAKAFTTPQREPQVILTSAEVPVASRSTARTPLYYVFGRAGSSDQLAMPPRNKQELRIRHNVHAIPILNRISEAVTALGTLVIDGLDLDRDWVTTDDLLTLIEQLPRGRILWCGSNTLANFPEEFRELLQSGHIITSPQRLGTLLAELHATGRLQDVQTISDEPGVITFQNGFYSPSPTLRIRVEASASIVDDSWVGFQAPLGDETAYSAFRRFHGDTEGPRGLVYGIESGFAIQRDFEPSLHSKVFDGIENAERYKGPLILHGQSGTGKSIALARLISVLLKDRRSAVLYSTTRVPLSTEIEEYCAEAELSGALATVIVCDTNASLGRYGDLVFGLKSRGRRVVLVGSAYRQIDLPGRAPETFIEAPDELSQGERNSLSALINRFGGKTTSSEMGGNRHVLVNLYHLLPSTRARLAAGLGREVRSAEEQLRTRAAGSQMIARGSGVFAEKLREAGLESSDETLLTNVVDDALKGIDDDAAKLIDYVMIPGQIGCAVPVDLLLRALNRYVQRIGLDRVVQLFEGLDIFRWRQGETSEDFLLAPRLMLEAELICRRRLLNARIEGDRLVELISATRLTWDSGGSERRFLLDVLQRMGPDGPRKNYYRDTYLSAARALTDLRTKYGVWDPSLMLQESVLRRCAIRESVVPDEQHTAILEEARAAVQEALDGLQDRRASGAARMKSNLMGERATIFGFLAIHEARAATSIELIWSAYRAARTAAKAAIGINENYFPLDVSLWIPADLLTDAPLPEEYRIELIADIHAVLDRIDPTSFPLDQQLQYNKRKYILGQVLSAPELSDDAFEALKQRGSTAGYFLRARTIGPEFHSEAPDDATDAELEGARRAVAFLTENWTAIKDDDRCLRYYLQCRWLLGTRRRLFRGERALLPYSESDRRDILETVQAINSLTTNRGENPLRYLEAVLNWLLGHERHAAELFRDLSRDSDYLDPRRVNRRHVVADREGVPQVFSGRIEAETDPGRYTVRVDGLDKRIQLLERDFPNRNLSYGRSVSGFAIAFNFIGPVADPVAKRGSSK